MCPAGSNCIVLDMLPTPLCLPQCSGGGDCRGTGYVCGDYDDDDSLECLPYAAGTRAVGEPCAGIWECGGGEYGYCGTHLNGYPSGYCTVDCSVWGTTCPAGSHCTIVWELGVTVCFEDCTTDSECRVGYACTDIDSDPDEEAECAPR
jgi:hypothetical protein